MSDKLYLCDRCYLKFFHTGEEGSQVSCAEEGCSCGGAGVKCPQCGSLEVRALPFDPKMLLDLVALFRTGISPARRG